MDAQPVNTGRQARRTGGRTGRIAARAAGPVRRAVWPGMSGGRYRPLSERDIERIHDTALDVLANIGIGQPNEELLAAALPKGCIHDREHNRLRIPRALMEDLIAVAAKSYVVHGVDPRHDQEISGERVIFTTSGEAISIMDFRTRHFRPSTLLDLYDAARLADKLENIHSFGQPFIATELSTDVPVHDVNVAYAELAGTQKPFAMGIAMVQNIDTIIAMFDTFLGREGAFLERPFCTFGGCPIVSPLRFGQENLEVLIKMARLGLPGDVAVAAQAGATAPAALAGALVQTFAETLGCLAVMNLIRPGSALNFGMWPFISDLRTGAFSGGSGEEALVIAAAAQIANHYGLITSMPSGMSDSKIMDAQAGYEKAITTLVAALAGSNMVCNYPGMLGSLIGMSFEGMVIDDDMVGNVMRVLRGIEVTDETLSYSVIHDTVFGVGHYLGSAQTLELMQSEYLYPHTADRRTPGEWESTGREDILELANRKTHQILSTHYPEYIPPAADERIRARFPIRLARADMRPGNARW
jgi:trimethylamine--corrinoid protein Co-methyltransferase